MTTQNDSPAMTAGPWVLVAVKTDEQKAEFAQQEKRVNELIDPILNIVKTENTISADNLKARFAPEQEDDIKEGIWRLFNMGYLGSKNGELFIS